jgi:ADP-ribosyl-[dinitrogen reductase] hydrolase
VSAGSPPSPLANSYWVVPGSLLAGEHPGGASTEATRARLKMLTGAGVRCFIDLTQEGEVAAYEPLLPKRVHYFRRPIPDHGVPAARAHMNEVLERVREALSAKRPVYLHCRAGIGRTGMAAGCWLVESGYTGEQAIEELNRLWQQSARSAQWPSVPETNEQSEYVRRWRPAAAAPGADPLLEPATLAAARTLRERFLGTLLGLAAGDAVGVATQFGRPGRFKPVGDLLGGGPFDLPRGAWSDDTAMALCLAESLLEKSGFDPRDQVARYRRWQQEGYLSATDQCVGITAATARALAQAQWRRQPFSGSHDPGSTEPEALSRVAPVALYYFADAERSAEESAQAARTTSQASAVLEACRSLARALHAALVGADKGAILAAAAWGPAAGEGEPTAASVLAAALQAFGQTENFRDAVLQAANLGGPADVTACVTGALAGAHYGQGAIPSPWRNSLMKLEVLEGFADRLLTHALLSLA